MADRGEMPPRAEPRREGHASAPRVARYRVVRGGAAGESWSSDDPRVVFALVLEEERRRRDGGEPPCLAVECMGAWDAPLLGAIRAHAPWVEVRAAAAPQRAASIGASVTTPAPSSLAAKAPSLTLTPAELTMLFGSGPAGAEPA